MYNTGQAGDPDAGWSVAGGTSASAPMLAAVIALAGHPARFADAAPLYGAATGLTDAATGSNVLGTDCGGDYQCTAGPGYDSPTGNGTPDGLGAFRRPRAPPPRPGRRAAAGGREVRPSPRTARPGTWA